jgi:ribonuclease HI
MARQANAPRAGPPEGVRIGAASGGTAISPEHGGLLMASPIVSEYCHLSKSPLALRIYADGSCQPVNPGGYACWAWHALDADGRELAFAYGCLGHGPGMTNNLAEAHAILQALEWAQREQLRSVVIHSDSQLLVQQVRGSWAVNAPHLIRLVKQARELLAELGGQIDWIPREANVRADRLTREAYLAARKEARHGS